MATDIQNYQTVHNYVVLVVDTIKAVRNGSHGSHGSEALASQLALEACRKILADLDMSPQDILGS